MTKEEITEAELEKAYENYAQSHWAPPEAPNGPLLAGQLWSVIPMEHSLESFSEEYKKKKRLYKKYKPKYD